ncbi:unnamed protein product, partial [Musa acuminata subsp. malaccensis]
GGGDGGGGGGGGSSSDSTKFIDHSKGKCERNFVKRG